MERHKFTDFSEEHIASIFRAEEQAKHVACEKQRANSPKK
jgi:hypothetical protein